MPRLHGTADKHTFNLYDSLSPRALLAAGSKSTMFGPENIGREARTNIQKANLPVVNDDSAYLMNWYARTNIAELEWPAFLAWAHATRVTLKVGERPVKVLPLPDLLKRKEGDRFEPAAVGGAHDGTLVDHLAARIYDATRVGPTPPWDELTNQPVWRAAARAALDVCRPPSLLIVPPRQTFQVEIESSPRALSALLEVLPTSVAPEALAWVHIEGFSRRDHC